MPTRPTAVAAPCDCDFNVAARIARTLFGFNESAICFAGSSPATEKAFVAWIKAHLHLIEKNKPMPCDGGGDDGGGGDGSARRRHRARRR